VLSLVSVILAIAGLIYAIRSTRKASQELRAESGDARKETAIVRRLVNVLARALERSGAIESVTWNAEGDLSGFAISGQDKATVHDQASVSATLGGTEAGTVAMSGVMEQHDAAAKQP
jgi:hypothetical protein